MERLERLMVAHGLLVVLVATPLEKYPPSTRRVLKDGGRGQGAAA